MVAAPSRDRRPAARALARSIAALWLAGAAVSARADVETVRVSHAACPGAPPLVEGHDVIAQLRVELVGAPLVVASDAGGASQARPARELSLDLCGARARISRRWPSGSTDTRELDVSVFASEARVRIVALVLAELARADLRDPGAAPPAPSPPPAPSGSAYAALLSSPERPPTREELARFARPRPLSQDITFTVRAFAAPAAAAFGPRLALDVGRWEIGLESATASSQRGTTQVLMNLASASVGYQALRYGDDVRVDVTPSAELGVTWYRTSASADGGGASSSEVRPPDTSGAGVWAAATVRAGVTVAVTPPIHARFGIFAGYALGLRAKVNERTELTSAGAFGGLGLGVGWER
jgi:hypothetical protein